MEEPQKLLIIACCCNVFFKHQYLIYSNTNRELLLIQTISYCHKRGQLSNNGMIKNNDFACVTSNHGHWSGLVFSKQFLLTLVVGVTFGFSFAYMLLGAAGAGRRELFQGPPYPVDVDDPHDHQVLRLLWKERNGDVYLDGRRPK